MNAVHRFSGYENYFHEIDGLLSYWNYKVTVSTNTTVGFSPNPKTTVHRTRESSKYQFMRYHCNIPVLDQRKLWGDFKRTAVGIANHVARKTGQHLKPHRSSHRNENEQINMPSILIAIASLVSGNQ